MWDIDTEPITGRSSGSGAARWVALLGDEDLVEDVQDYWVYAQLKAQGEDTVAPRHVTGVRKWARAGRERHRASACTLASASAHFPGGAGAVTGGSCPVYQLSTHAYTRYTGA